MSTERRRVPAGVPEGGQYAAGGEQYAPGDPLHPRRETILSANGVKGSYNLPGDTAIVYTYQAGEMQEINDALRRGRELNERQLEEAEAFDEVIARGELTKDRKVYRVVDMTSPLVAQFYAGAEFTDKGFVSTSSTADAAEGIAFEWGYNKPVFLEISARRGTKALDMNAFNEKAGNDTGMESQEEIVFGRGHRFVVTGRSKRKSSQDNTQLSVIQVEMS